MISEHKQTTSLECQSIIIGGKKNEQIKMNAKDVFSVEIEYSHVIKTNGGKKEEFCCFQQHKCRYYLLVDKSASQMILFLLFLLLSVVAEPSSFSSLRSLTWNCAALPVLFLAKIEKKKKRVKKKRKRRKRLRCSKLSRLYLFFSFFPRRSNVKCCEKKRRRSERETKKPVQLISLVINLSS